MKFLADFLPIIIFFGVYKWLGIYAATASAIVASFFQVGYTWLKHKRFENMQVITFFIILILGGATLLLHDEMFIKWKPTAINWLFALAFLLSQYIGKKNITQRLLDSNVNLPAIIWKRLNISWVGFFVIMGMVNLYVVYHFNTNTWVNFKLFGMLGLTVVFVIAQAFYLARHLSHDQLKQPRRNTK